MHGASAVRKNFVPADIADCRCWLRSDLGVGLVGSKVADWRCQVSGTSFSRSVDAERPTYAAGANGVPKIVFAGSHALKNSSLFMSGPSTVLQIIRLTSTPGASSSVVSYVYQSAASSTTRSVFIFMNVGGYQNVTFKNDLNASGISVGFNPTLDTTLHAFLTSYNGGLNTSTGSYAENTDGAEQSVVASASIGSASAFFTSLGGTITDPGDVVADGISADLYEWALWSRPLSLTEKLSIWGYVKNRYP